jgi:nitroreductase
MRMTTFNDTSSLLAFLKTRKSASAKAMGGEAPSAAQIDEILELATRVPDHGKLAPWRFVIFEGKARQEIGQRFKARWAQLYPEHGEDSLNFQAGLFARAPLVIVVVSSPQEHPKIPLWEQQMSAAAVSFNLELAAQALGFDVQWQTDWVAYDEGAKTAMGIKSGENVAGIIYIGKTAVALEDRPRPEVAKLVTHWSA